MTSADWDVVQPSCYRIIVPVGKARQFKLEEHAKLMETLGLSRRGWLVTFVPGEARWVRFRCNEVIPLFKHHILLARGPGVTFCGDFLKYLEAADDYRLPEDVMYTMTIR